MSMNGGNSMPPNGVTSTDELKAMLGALTDSHRQSNDKIVEILVRLEGQRETINGHSNMLAKFNERLNSVENKAERTARLQEEQEGSILAEVGVLANNDKKQNAEIAAIRLETHAQSITLADHSGQMASIKTEMVAIRDESEKQNVSLEKQSESLIGLKADVSRILIAFNKIETWKKAAVLLVMGAPGAWIYIQKFLEHH